MFQNKQRLFNCYCVILYTQVHTHILCYLRTYFLFLIFGHHMYNVGTYHPIKNTPPTPRKKTAKYKKESSKNSHIILWLGLSKIQTIKISNFS